MNKASRIPSKGEFTPPLLTVASNGIARALSKRLRVNLVNHAGAFRNALDRSVWPSPRNMSGSAL
ncbi:hypothetical protein PR003_g23162 [Phytophthora rubi]|uniref:Uncharacterized protein n=1 Tax=Phytophthora rubi TaxID=129364 RepID=A0A6A3IV72_9STRA|nr:hypothetical protein PR002_g22493 [Phytophthora rubi]KAE9298732.1 hypothetical protein PR003_g23162 [Phytophthora rubi]